MPGSKKLEVIDLETTGGAPNSVYPVLVYRDVILDTKDPDSVVAMLSGNKYLPYGFFGAIPPQHFHANTHEVYAFISGKTTFKLGYAGDDDPALGHEVTVGEGDVLMLPVSHGCLCC